MVFAPLAAFLAAAVEAVRRPALLVCLTVILVAIPYGSGDGSASSPDITLADAGSALLVGVVAVRVFAGRPAGPAALTGRTGPAAPLWIPLWCLLSAMLLALAIATINGQYLSASLQGFVRFAQLFVLVPAAVAVCLRDARDRRLVLGTVVLLALFEGGVGVWQAVTGHGASYDGAYVRAIGTFGSRDIMAMSVVVGAGLLIAFGHGLALRGRARAAAWAAALLLVPPLVLSLSRGTWIAVAFAAAVMLALTGTRVVLRTLIFGTALLVVLVGGFGVGAGLIGERLDSISSSGSTPDKSVSDRYDLWGTAAAIWRDHPITGVGPKNFARFRDSYAPLGLSSGSDVDDPSAGYEREELLSPHNMYLLVLSEQGLLGAVAFLGLMGALVVRGIDRTRSRPVRAVPPLRALGLAATGLIVFTLTDFAYGDTAGSVAVFNAVLLGIVMWWSFAPLPPAPEPGVRP